MKSNTTWQNIGIGLIGFTILGVIIGVLFYEIGQAPWQFITILIALFGAVITAAANLNIQIRNEQKPNKVQIYEKVINFFFDTMFVQKSGKTPVNEEELIEKFHDIIPDLILWASDDVLALYIKFRQLGVNNTDTTSSNLMLIFGQMLLAMRKDLGHQNNKIDELSILSTFVNDIENLPQ